MKRLGLALILIVIALPLSFAQSDPGHSILNYFRINLSGDQVYLSWEISGGNTCNGINIYRSTNDTDYVKIGDIAGVCGSLDFPQSYNFIDDDPVSNAYNYYRIELGVQGTSNSISVHYIDLENSDYVLYPNPVEENSVIYFDNPDNLSYDYRVYDMQGNLITSLVITQGSEFPVGNAVLNQKGMYLFQLISEDNTNIITGKLLVN